MYTRGRRHRGVNERRRLLFTVAAISTVAVIALLAVILAPGALPSNCPNPPGRTLLGSLSLGFSNRVVTSANTSYSWYVQYACNGLTWGSLTSVVEVVKNSTSGSPVTSGWSLAGQTSSAITIATYDPSTSSWTGPSTQLIHSGDLFTWETTGYLTNMSLNFTLTGTGQFSGSLSWCACGI